MFHPGPRSKRVQHPEFDTTQDRKFQFGQTELGPVVADYLARLYTHILAFEQEHGARTLFVSRAGVRIRRAMDVFLRACDLPPLASSEFFWISRLMVAKGVWNRDRDGAIEIFSKEFEHAPLFDFVRAMFRFSPRGSKLNPADRELLATGQDLGRFLESQNQFARILRTFFEQQGKLFEAYVKSVMGDARCALLVDTGWQGRSQNLLTSAFPEIDWWGAYFGRSGSPSSDRANWHKMIGIAFESDQFDPARPQTCVVLNRHLIENLFEPAGRSIEWLAEPAPGTVVAPDADSVLADAPTRESDPIFAGVLSYLEMLQDGNRPSLLRRRAAEAWSRIARMTVHPTSADLALFDTVERSADFGRDLKVPMLLSKKARFDGDTPDLRIRDALWPCGQAAVEYPGEIAKPLQKKLAGVTRTALPEGRLDVARTTRPRVAVITRTMDRPMFLKRALDSVARQTYSDFIHVVVNDGGDNEAVKTAIEGANIDHARVRLIDAVVNRGMEAASNLAIRNSESDYIVIHDDDDTWAPAFLEKTVEFLDGPQGAHYGGVITQSIYCSEEVTPEGVVVHARTPYNDWIENVHLMEMAIENFFPPIAFVFRREMWERLDGFNEQYPVLGDWDFNLRFLVEADIAVINEPLANYHHRDRGDVTTFGNSVIAGRGKHLEYSAIVRNNFVRSMVKRGHAAAATLAGMGTYLADQRTTVRASNRRVAQIAQDTSAVAAQMRSLGSSRAWGDSYWFALQTLLKALAENDTAKLDEIAALASGTAGSATARVMSLVRQTRSVKNNTPLSPANLERASARLLKDAVERQQGAIANMPIPPDFDEAAYLLQNSDVEQRVKDGALSSGYEHYVLYGRSEGRFRPLR